MPYTLAHPLYAVPLKKAAPRYLCTTGLLLGSMAPDLEYFVAFESNKTFGHSIQGFVLLGLPLCTAFAIAFHRLMKPALVKLLPSSLGLSKFARDHSSPWELATGRDWFVFLSSLFIGFLSHMFMDAWTHTDTFIVHHLPWLAERIYGEAVYHWLQFGLSALGLGAAMLYGWWKWSRWRKRRSEPLSAEQRAYRWGMRLAAAAIAAVLFLLKLKSGPTMHGYGFTTVAPVSALAVGWFVAAALYYAAMQQRLAQLIGLLGLFGLSVIAFQLAQRLPFTSIFPYLGWIETIGLRLGSARWELAVWIGFIWIWSFFIIAISLQRKVRRLRGIESKQAYPSI